MSCLQEITVYLDDLLRLRSWKDFPGAYNGLQVENSGKVEKVAAAVDGCETVIQHAVQEKVSLLIVHHCLFWGGTNCWIGASYRKMHATISADLAIYSAHLPLDAHPEYGNNVLLARACSFTKYDPFLEVFGMPIGVRMKTEIDREDLLKRVKTAVGGGWVQLVPGGPQVCKNVGIVTGAGGTEVSKLAEEGIDTFITGEGQHRTVYAAEEAGVNLIYAGHYATETFGVKAIAKHISDRFHLPWIFIDHPSGR